MKYLDRLTFLLLFIFQALPLRAEIEPKRPLGPQQQLKVQQQGRQLIVTGETFDYSFSKANGLISGVKVLGQEITDGTPIPDLMVAEQLDPSVSPYAARHEARAQVSLVSEGPARVVIHAQGTYTAEEGKRFPLRYSITYDISIDGVILVTVDNTALEACTFRWLSLSGGRVRRDLAKFLNWMPEQATAQTTSYQFRPLDSAPNGKILGGIWIPWIWIGDQRVGLEVTTWDVSSQTYNQVDNSARLDEAEMFSVWKEESGVRWENFLVRRTRIFANPGWTRSGQFALAVTPSKRFDPYFALVKGAHLGPHQHEAQLKLPNEQQIRTLAQNGYNLIVGMANWRSGEYVPLNEAELRQTITRCHQLGVKIIPYITLVDLSHATEAFRQHGEEWAIEPTTEFCKLSRPDLAVEMAFPNDPEKETTLMCPGATGWRAHWKQQIDRVIRDYDFDGIYFDFWYGRMVCENARHGCGGRFRRATVLGSREMLMYAYNRLKAKDPHTIIKANTNTLATALITSLVDIRLVGESTDATKMDPASRQWLYTSYRLGEPTEFLWAETRWNTQEKAAFAVLVNFLPQYYWDPPFEPRKSFDDFDVFRSFDDGKGSWQLGISGQEGLRTSQSEVRINLVERAGRKLATFINTGKSATAVDVPIGKDWLAYDPLGERLLVPGSLNLRVELAGGAYRHLLLAETAIAPQLLCVLGARSPAKSSLDQKARQLRFSAEAAEGSRLRVTVYSPESIKKITNVRGEKLSFHWTPETRLAQFEASHIPGDKFAVSY